MRSRKLAQRAAQPRVESHRAEGDRQVLEPERLLAQRPLSALVAAVPDDEGAPREQLYARSVAPRNHLVCNICGRTLMTGERAERDTRHGHEAEVVCELCQRQGRRGCPTRGR
jgi:hypothetical protein